MANVFLSYSRKDLKRAKAIASSLERAGHSVWWDRRIEGGAEYSKQIEAALRSADVVVVLWSRASVDSAWVRDEASIGRDSNRLVPVLIEPVHVPIGFKQYQTLDLSTWAGRGDPNALKQLKAAVASKAVPPVAPNGAEAREERQSALNMRRYGALAAALVLFVMAALLVRVLHSSESTGDKLSLAVMPFADLSSAGDQTHLGEGIAEEIVNLLSGDPAVTIIGRTSVWEAQKHSSGVADLKRRLGATHVLEGSVRSAGGMLKVSARLLDASTSEQLWAEEFHRKTDDIFALQEQIGAAVAQRLRGTFSGARERRQVSTTPEVYKLYLAAKALIRKREYSSLAEADRLLTRAIELDPDFAPAHAFLAINMELLEIQRPNAPHENRPSDVDRALTHARRALALAPRLPESHVALGMVLGDGDGLSFADPRPALEALQRAKGLDPNNYYAWNTAGNIHRRAGCRYRESLADYSRAAAIEPLLAAPHNNLIYVLRDLNRPSEGDEVVAGFTAANADPPRAYAMRGMHEHGRGNIGLSVQLLNAASNAGVTSAVPKRHLSDGLRLLGRSDEAAAELPADHRALIEPYWRTNYDRSGLVAESRASRMWESVVVAPVVAKALVRSGRGQLLLKAVERRWSSIEGFSSMPVCQLHALAPTVILALLDAKRQEDAKRVLQAVVSEHRLRIRNGYAAPDVHAISAALLVLQGRADQALEHLDKAVESGWVNQWDPQAIGLHDPVFDVLRSQPRFRRLEQTIQERLSRQAAAADSS